MKTQIPLREKLKSIPAFVGIRLDYEPEYVVQHEFGNIEIREYRRMVTARFSMKASHDDFEEPAFKALADYIFSHGIEMTIPVFKEREDDVWTMSFVLPHETKVERAPSPDHKSVTLLEIPRQKVAVLRYSGNNTLEKMLDAELELRQWLRARPEYNILDGPFWAQYDQPATLPFMKRNEVMFKIEG